MTTDARILVLMPTAKDGERMGRVLAEAGLGCAVCKDVVELCREIRRGAGAAMLTEEAVVGDHDGCLLEALHNQPPWSDFPLVVLAREGSEGHLIRESMNATLVERPVKVRSLLSVVRAALRSRRHQYSVRDHLAERVRAEEEVVRLAAESERQRRVYETALSNTADFNYVFDLRGRFVYVNAALLALWGKALHEAVGKDFFELDYPPELAGHLQRQIQEAIETRQPIRDETPFTSATGTRDYEYIFVPVIGSGGTVEAVAGSTRDITDRKAMVEELRDTDRKKDDFIALLAHELRNPLAPIRNGLQVLRLAGGDVDAVGQARAMMDRQLTHMVRLIDDLLDVSRISRNKMELRRERVLLGDVVGSAVETARPLIDASGHDLSLSMPPGPVFLDADLTRLAQVFSNLLTNSAKYTGRGGKIRLAAERRGGEVVVTVGDNGIGIPAASLGNIFDMFSQVDRSVERNTGGLGIGLALVKGLVEMHGGTVTAASEGEGKGSAFTVRLPVVEGRPAPLQPGLADNGQHGPGRRVLVVDDNRDGAASMAMMLRLMGDEVRTAHDGFEAVEAAEQFHPEVILMDVGMPRLNGPDATRRIREQPWGRTMTIIALTGWGQDGDKERSREAGCNGHLVKPVNLQDLEKLLGEVRV